MPRPMFLAISATLLLTTMSFMGTSVVNASTPNTAYDPQEECTSRAWNIWAENCDGWHVNIENTLNTPAKYYEGNAGLNPLDVSTGVYEAPESIATQTTTTILGKESGSGGPTNMFIIYNTPELAESIATGFIGGYAYSYPYSWRRFVEIKSNFLGKTTVDCGVFRVIAPTIRTKQKEYVGCDVVNATPNEPISVRFTDTGEGRWRR
jgi:hypothetical protein